MTPNQEWLNKLNDIAIVSRKVPAARDARVEQAKDLLKMSKKLVKLAEKATGDPFRIKGS